MISLLIAANVLLVIVDDVGYEDSLRMTKIRDHLTTEFVSAYSNPTCSPTRACMFTGRYGFRTGVPMAFQDNGEGDHLALEEVTLPEALPSEYTSWMVGKWHLGDRFPEAGVFLDPVFQGWDGASVTKHNLDDHYSYTKYVSYPWGGFSAPVSQYSTVETTQDALALIDILPEPWFLTVSYHAGHKPFQVPPGGVSSGDDRDHYLQSLDFIDDQLDALFDVVGPSTEIYFIGDNGTPKEVGGEKGELTEGGIHVPLLVNSQYISAGCVGSRIHAVDLFALILQSAGEPFPRGLDCVSLGTRDIVFSEIRKPIDGPPYDKRDEVAALNGGFKVWRDNLNGIEEFRSLPNDELIEICINPEAYADLSGFLDEIE